MYSASDIVRKTCCKCSYSFLSLKNYFSNYRLSTGVAMILTVALSLTNATKPRTFSREEVVETAASQPRRVRPSSICRSNCPRLESSMLRPPARQSPSTWRTWFVLASGARAHRSKHSKSFSRPLKRGKKQCTVHCNCFLCNATDILGYR